MFEDRVARGIALLDQFSPGWEECIDPDRINLGSSQSCVLGQIFSSYYSGLIWVFGRYTRETATRSVEYGFTLDDEDVHTAIPTQIDRYYDYLADAWRSAIRARIEART